MSEWKKFVRIVKTAPKSDILILIVTFVLTVIFDLVVAIAVGMVLTAMLFMKRMSDETAVNGWKYIDPETDQDAIHLRAVPKDVRVYEISGPLFFGAADKIPEIILKDYTRCLILRMRAVPSLDSTALNALEALYKKCKKQDVRLILSHVNEQPLNAMQKSGFYDAVGAENFCLHIDEALEKASAQ
jgi:SulP family sulfate permease